MRKFLGIFGLFWVLIGVATSDAQAGVKLCNKSGDTLQIAIAHNVTVPYVTNEARGWYTLEDEACQQVIAGDLGIAYTFYYFMLKADSTVYEPEGVKAAYPICVTGEAFIRRGSWKKLQYKCPKGWVTRQFYEHLVPPGDLTITIYE